MGDKEAMEILKKDMEKRVRTILFNEYDDNTLGELLDDSYKNLEKRAKKQRSEKILKYLDSHEEGLTAEDVYELRQMIIKGE